MAFLACLYTLQAGRAARRFYEAHWATEANAMVQDSPSNPAPDRVVALLDNASDLDTAATIHPDQVQTVIGGSGTLTNKLRALASLANIQWRHSRGHKKHMRNGDIREALAPLIAPDLLAQLS